MKKRKAGDKIELLSVFYFIYLCRQQSKPPRVPALGGYFIIPFLITYALAQLLYTLSIRLSIGKCKIIASIISRCIFHQSKRNRKGFFFCGVFVVAIAIRR